VNDNYLLKYITPELFRICKKLLTRFGSGKTDITDPKLTITESKLINEFYSKHSRYFRDNFPGVIHYSEICSTIVKVYTNKIDMIEEILK
jgi:hypothetical protein